MQLVLIRITVSETNGLHHSSSTCGERCKSATCWVAWHPFRCVWLSDMPIYHSISEEGYAIPPHSLLCSGSFFNGVFAFNWVHCCWGVQVAFWLKNLLTLRAENFSLILLIHKMEKVCTGHGSPNSPCPYQLLMQVSFFWIETEVPVTSFFVIFTQFQIISSLENLLTWAVL